MIQQNATDSDAPADDALAFLLVAPSSDPAPDSEIVISSGFHDPLTVSDYLKKRIREAEDKWLAAGGKLAPGVSLPSGRMMMRRVRLAPVVELTTAALEPSLKSVVRPKRVLTDAQQAELVKLRSAALRGGQ